MSYNSIVAMTPDEYVYRHNQGLRQKEIQEERDMIRDLHNSYMEESRLSIQYFGNLVKESELRCQLAEEKLKQFKEDNNRSNRS